MSPEETIRHLRIGTPLDQVRIIFSGECGRIEQENMQRRKPTPIEMRGMEFDAVLRIIAKVKELDL